MIQFCGNYKKSNPQFLTFVDQLKLPAEFYKGDLLHTVKESPFRQSSSSAVFDSDSLPNVHRTLSESGSFTDFISDAVVTFDRLGRIHYLNLAARTLFGLAEDEYAGKPLRQLFPLLSDDQLCGAESSFVQHSQPGCAWYLPALAGNGRELSVSLIAASVVDSHYCQLLLRDNDEGHRYREDLLHQREINQAAFRSVSDGVIITNVRGEIESLNPIARQFLGVSPHAGLGVPLDELLTLFEADTQKPLPSLVEEALRRGRIVQVDSNLHLYGSEASEPVAVAVQVTPIRNGKNLVCGCVIVIRLESDGSKVSSHLSWQSTHDLLTQLPNRHYFESELSRAVAVASLGEVSHGFLYIDLYHFKLINDTCGHAAGDELLRQLALLFGKKMRSQDLLARLGSDEFGILLRNCTLAGTQRVADILLREVQAFRFQWDGQQFKVGVSVGALVLDKTIESEAQALSAAHASCCAAKEAGRNRIHLYHNDNVMARRRSEMHWVVKINEALAENRLVLYRQPIVAAAGGHTGPPHFEVLVRMCTPEGELISPVEFIPAAERYGLMDEVDRWVLRHILKYLRQRKQLGLPDESYAVNLSGVSLSDESFCEYVWTELAESGVSPKLLHFEITETAAVCNLQRAVEFMQLFGEKGCQFYLDDFGSGMSSFAYLKDFPVHYLKIDGSFVKGMEADATNFAMVSTINHLAHVMGIKTVAEYVENSVLLDHLKQIGVDYVQGYGIAMPAEIKMEKSV